MTDVLDDVVAVSDAPLHTADHTAPAEAAADETADAGAPAGRARKRLIVGIAASLLLTLVALTGWLAFRVYAEHQSQQLRAQYLAVGRQGAINLTSIDFVEADDDIRRILDSATGQFHDDFAKRSGPFVEVLQQAQSKTVGTVTAAGIESSNDTGAQVLVAITVDTSSGGQQGETRSWRMRITVQRADDTVKVSKVEFVS